MRTETVNSGSAGSGYRAWLILALACVLSAACGQPDRSPPDRSLGADLTGPSEGYSRALVPRRFLFPQDHAAHPGFKIEWWYLTGNLHTAGGRRFGYQFTLFRNAVAPSVAPRRSRWATSQLYLAHAALTDVESERFHSDERYARGALGLAGASERPLRIWLEDWRMTGIETACRDCLNLELRVAAAGFSLSLQLRSERPVVLHGVRGLSAKSETPGNASYYYSYTRLATRGEITVGAQRHLVQGQSWFDHEWSTSALEADQAGWDWFAAQLSDGTDLMLFRLRRSSRKEDFYSGTVVAADGTQSTLSAGQFSIDVTSRWRSPQTGVVYPGGWRLTLPARKLDLTVAPLLAGQEMAHSFRYWEGAVSINGVHAGVPVSGHGYVELTGYQ